MFPWNAWFCLVAAAIAAQANLLISTNTSGQGEITPNLRLVATVDNKSFFSDCSVRRNWFAANAFCKSMNMRLATITSEAQFSALNSSSLNFECTDYLWTAGRDAHDLRQFIWDDTNDPLSAWYLEYQEGSLQLQTCVLYNNLVNNASYITWSSCNDTAGTLCESI